MSDSREGAPAVIQSLAICGESITYKWDTGRYIVIPAHVGEAIAAEINGLTDVEIEPGAES